MLTAVTMLPAVSMAQDGVATLTFAVEVSGVHNVPTSEGGFRNVRMSRIFRGTARMKFLGHSVAAPPTQGYDRAAFERQKDACEQQSSNEDAIAACQDEVQERQNAAERAAMGGGGNPLLAAMQGARTEAWGSQSCSGTLEIADRGTYKGITPGAGMHEAPYSLTTKHAVAENAAGGDGCSFTLLFNPQAQTAEINIDPGPPRVAAVLNVGGVVTKTNLNPFDWSAIRKFERGNLKVTMSKTGHTGSWSEASGEPQAIAGEPRVKGDVVQTATRITWQFTGKPQ